jgi:endonuclease/exonuclease/phosphatase (EEP) superfamily protein YafD
MCRNREILKLIWSICAFGTKLQTNLRRQYGTWTAVTLTQRTSCTVTAKGAVCSKCKGNTVHVICLCGLRPLTVLNTHDSLVCRV